MNESKLTYRFIEALNWAATNTLGETRKGSSVPASSHPLAVASLVMDYGGSEDEVIAALLHDEAEDGGGEETLARIAIRFGEKVARIVRECSDALPALGQTKKPWQQRKDEHLSKLPAACASTHLVYLADKVHNMRSLVMEYTRHGESVWTRFNGGKDGTLWYYRELIGIFEQSAVSRELLSELEKAFAELSGMIREVRNEGKTD